MTVPVQNEQKNGYSILYVPSEKISCKIEKTDLATCSQLC